MCKTYPRALTIAGSDSSGGAGIQADIKAMSAIGVYAMSAITAITAQNTAEVHSVQAATLQIVADQIHTICSDIMPDAVKTGMLCNAEIAATVAQCIKELGLRNVVVDPVMVSTSGYRLLEPDAIEAMTTLLFPLACVITPNKPEAELLCGHEINSEASAIKAGELLKEKYQTAILLKGGHFDGDEIIDYLFLPDTEGVISFKSIRIHTRNTHGTGCTLSSAIASYLALGNNLADAIDKARKYLYGALQAGANIEIGHGHGPVNHLFNPEKLHII